MGIDYVEVLDVLNAGSMEADLFLTEWLNQFIEPLLMLMMAMQQEKMLIMWEQMPTELHEQMKEQQPEKYAQVEKMLQQVEKGAQYAYNS